MFILLFLLVLTGSIQAAQQTAATAPVQDHKREALAEIALLKTYFTNAEIRTSKILSYSALLGIASLLNLKYPILKRSKFTWCINGILATLFINNFWEIIKFKYWGRVLESVERQVQLINPTQAPASAANSQATPAAVAGTAPAPAKRAQKPNMSMDLLALLALTAGKD